MKTLKNILLVLMIGLLLATQLGIPMDVRADGETPPPTEATEVVVTPEPVETTTGETATPDPTEEMEPTPTPDPVESPTEAVPTEPLTEPEVTELPTEAVATEVPIATDTPVPATETSVEVTEAASPNPEPAATTVAAETEEEPDPTALEILQEIPGETEVVVLDENGQSLPLATQDAEEVIVTSDPMWCPAGAAPGDPGCTASYATVTDLINNLGSMSGAGTIYFTPIYTTDDVYLNHDDPNLVNLTDLTIQGGWNGSTGSGFTLYGNTLFTVPIYILNWIGDLTLNNVTVQYVDTGGGYAVVLHQQAGDTTINDSNISDNNGSGLYINSDNVKLNRTTVNNNYGDGATIFGRARVEINDSHFEKNASNGLSLYSNDDVTIDNSSFSENWNNGARIDAYSANIYNSCFDYNSSNGLSLTADEYVTLYGSTFNANWGQGASLESINGAIGVYYSQFDFNSLSGADIITQNNNANIFDSTFNWNFWDYGAFINASSLDVSYSQFSGNGTDGLFAYLNNDAASNNDANIFGSSFYANWESGAIIRNADNVGIDNSFFGQNGDYGVYIDAYQDVNLDWITSSDNYVGALIDTVGDVTVTNSTFRNDIWDGLQIFTNWGSDNYIWLAGNTFEYNNRNYSDGYGAWLVTDENDWIYAFENTFINNFAGLVAYTFNVYLDPSNYFDLNCYDWSIFFNWKPGNYCGPPLEPGQVPYIAPAVVNTQGKYVLTLDCAVENPPPVSLPNGDLVEIFCPVSGVARIARQDNATLPSQLPEGYTYASAFDVGISNKGRQTSVIDMGGFIRSSFITQTLEPGDTYSVMYWDEWITENGKLVRNPEGGEWVALKNYMKDPSGGPQSFDLNPDNPDDPRKIMSGVQVVGDRVEVSTNFPGVFVLVQY